MEASKGKDSRDNEDSKGSKTVSKSNMLLLAQPDQGVEKLKTLEPEDVIDFLHSYENANEAYMEETGHELKLKRLITGRVARDLLHVYKATSADEIKAALKEIMNKYDENKKEDAYYILEKGLKWNPNAVSGDRAVDQFFNTIRKIMRGNIEAGSTIEKQIVKLAIKKLPKEIGLNVNDYPNIRTYLSAGASLMFPPNMAKDYLEEQNKETSLLKLLEKYVRLKVWATRTKDLEADNIESIRKVDLNSSSAYPTVPGILHTPNTQSSQILVTQPPFESDVNASSIASAIKCQNDFMRQLPGMITTALVEAVTKVVPAVVNQTNAGIPVPNKMLQNGNALQQFVPEIVCYYCWEKGHKKPQCPLLAQLSAVRQQNKVNKPRGRSRANFRYAPVHDHHVRFAEDIMVCNFEEDIKATIQVQNLNNLWNKVRGSLDSGATVTVAGLKRHGALIKNLKQIPSRRGVNLPDGTRHVITCFGNANVKAVFPDGKSFLMENIVVFLIDDDNWSLFLVGHTDLKRYGATPDQLLYKRSV